MTEKFQSARYVSLPPLSATSFDEYSIAIRSLLRYATPETASEVDRIWRTIYRKLPTTTLLNGRQRSRQAHRLVEFLSGLTAKEGPLEQGLIIHFDELQQLLGMLDTAALVSFRELVWGLRTERARCGVVLLLDTVLESRLERWATDIVHRIREHGHALRLEEAYDHRFPAWLWPRWSALYSAGQDQDRFDPDLLLALGQFVERWDLANGPRTVVDVFSRALEVGVVGYGLESFVQDLISGRFRYFSKGAGIEKVVHSILADQLITGNPAREQFVKLLAAFPEGCPEAVLQRHLPDPEERHRVIAELFGPLLVNGRDGLALEATQRVRRPVSHLDDVLQWSWQTLPAYDALVERMPEMIEEALLPLIVPEHVGQTGWTAVDPLETKLLTGWQRYRGSFDEDFPDRYIAVFVGLDTPAEWPTDVDLAVALVVTSTWDSESEAELTILMVDAESAHLLVKMPALQPLDGPLPAEIERYRKFLAPEPFRPANLLAALVALRRLLGQEEVSETTRLRGLAFLSNATEIVLRSLIRGTVEVRPGFAVELTGLELLRALFVQAMRRRYPHYIPLARYASWKETLKIYRDALASDRLSTAQRQGNESIEGAKIDLYTHLFKQTSTAAGDSFVRSLGPLVTLEEKGRHAAIRLTSHPAENALIKAVQSARHGECTLMSAMDALLQLGWTEEEAKEIIALALTRGTLVQAGQSLRAVAQHISPLDQPKSVHVGGLGTASMMVPTATTSAHAKAAGSLELAELSELKDRIFHCLGVVRGTDICTDWPDSDIAVHLRSLAAELSRYRDSLLSSLRKFAEKLPEAPPTGWPRRRVQLLKELEKLGNRTSLFDTRAGALKTWSPLNMRLSELRTTIDHLTANDRGSKALHREFEELTSTLRERFATEAWSPVCESISWDGKIGQLEQRAQRLQYDGLIAFMQRRRELIQQLGWAAEQPAPDWWDSVEGGTHSFDALTEWTLQTIERGLALIAAAKLGKGWRDPNGTQISHKELRRRCEKALLTARQNSSASNVATTVSLMARLYNGFEGSWLVPKTYTDPDCPPDFCALESAYRAGKLVIEVRPLPQRKED
jgi:hypothetical protein